MASGSFKTQDFKFNMDRFEAGLKEGFLTTGRNADEFLLTQGRGFIKTVVNRTPPASQGQTGLNAKRAGEGAIEADVRRVVIPIKGRVGPGITLEKNLEARLKPLENRTNGRIRKNAKKIYARQSEINREIRRRKAKVGRLAAGWNEGAKLTGARVPAWISRHRGKGVARLIFTEREARIRITNATEFVGNVQGFQKRVQGALNEQGSKMLRSAKRYYERKIERAGFEVSK